MRIKFWNKYKEEDYSYISSIDYPVPNIGDKKENDNDVYTISQIENGMINCLITDNDNQVIDCKTLTLEQWHKI